MSQERERTRYPQTDTPIPSQQRTETLIPSLFSFTALAFFFFGVVLLILLLVGIVKNWSLLTASTSVLVQVLIVLSIVALPLTLISIGIQKGYLSWLAMKQANIATLKAQEELAAMRDHRQRANEQHALELYLLESRLPADGLGNRAGIYNRETGELIIPPPGNYAPPVPHTLTLHYASPAPGTRVSEAAQPVLPASQQHIHVPTFGQLLASGEIYPGMPDILLCFELLSDEHTGLVCGYEPYRDSLENHSTMFLAGASKSGKTTLMAHVSAQQALLNAAFYLIDPHLSHPEKSLARKLAPLSHAFVLPPAMRDAEIFAVLTHAKAEMQARIEGRETPLTGRPIVFLVDEVLAVLARAQRTQNKEVIAVYRDLALFLRDLGTQYGKWLVAGAFASQYVTKDAFTLPGGKIDFRDGCHNQTILRLPPNQAQALRLLEPDVLRRVRSLPPGQGYMGLSTGELLHMGIGDVTVSDVAVVGKLVSAVAQPKHYQNGFQTGATPHQTRAASHTNAVFSAPFTPPVPLAAAETEEQDSGEVPADKPGEQQESSVEKVSPQKTLSSEQEVQFLTRYQHQPNIKERLRQMHLGTGYYGAAAALLERHNLRAKPG